MENENNWKRKIQNGFLAATLVGTGTLGYLSYVANEERAGFYRSNPAFARMEQIDQELGSAVGFPSRSDSVPAVKKVFSDAELEKRCSGLVQEYNHLMESNRDEVASFDKATDRYYLFGIIESFCVTAFSITGIGLLLEKKSAK